MRKLIKPVSGPVQLIHSASPARSSSLASVQIKVVGLCRTDLRVASGEISVTEPRILGHECAGVVIEDPSGQYAPGDEVSLNPLLSNKQFIGLDCDGALQDVLQIDPAQLICAAGIPAKVAAYLEPVAASMAVLKAKFSQADKGVIYYANRISHLTYLILKSLDYDVTWIEEPPPDNLFDVYDYVIETSLDETSAQNMLQVLKPGGMLVVKSRQPTPVPIRPNTLVAKELTLKAVGYWDFNEALQWLRTPQHLLAPLLGATYALEDWVDAFAAAGAGDAKKIFISLE